MENIALILSELNKIQDEISNINDKLHELFALTLETRKTQLKQVNVNDSGLLGCNNFPDDELLDKLEKQELQNAISEQIADEKKYNCIYPQS